MLRKFLSILTGIFLMSLLAIPMAKGQDSDMPGEDTLSDRVLLKKEMAGGGVIHNLGFGVNYRLGRNKTFFNSRILEFEVVSMRHPKQIRVINPLYYNARSYFYGKLNHVFMIRAGYGYKRLLNRKPYWGGVELRFLYLGGLSIGLAKPVYLYFWDETKSYINEERYDPNNYYHNSEYIYGRAPFTDGLTETSIHPGVYVKSGMNFEFGQYNSKIRSIEAGAVVEYFPRAIPIMARNPEQNFFVTFYINFELGKRYN